MPARPSVPPVVLARWKQDAPPDGSSVVLPDGCRDLILHVNAGGRCEWMVSHLADTAYEVPEDAQGRWLGYRFQPGACVDSEALLAAVVTIGTGAASMPHDPEPLLPRTIEHRVLDAIDACVRVDPRIQEALAALAEARSIRTASGALGVSERSLERLTVTATGQPPRYWRALARIRRAAQALAGPLPLVDIAADHGFSDQAHFSRECRRWLGLAPSHLRASPALLATVAAIGYD